MLRFLRPLDRYVFSEFVKIFTITALGFPVLLIIIDLTDNLDKYLNRKLSSSQIALSYVYWLPDSTFMVLPAAVLFATVFSIGGLTRHAEITAAKASGISFHRLILPIFFGAVLAAGGALWLGELVPITNARRLELLEERKYKAGADRFNFAYAADRGRVYKIQSLSSERSILDGIEIERRGSGSTYPSYILAAESGSWSKGGGWMLRTGTLHVMPTGETDVAFAFDSVRDAGLRERPMELLADPKAPQEMGFRDLSRFIAAMERSGGEVNELKVERMLKIAIPITCIIIALFGAPLATSTQRGGAAYGIGVSLGTTVIFLMLIQLTKAVGSGGLVPPGLAAWIPNMVFGVVGLVMMARVKT